ncbi:female-specific lacrimal gland protein-like [Erinaceus europaeus]|uniref:Female-specific lacrimal gland protein-like n=1 Tax=Erinaceus europaeus TaxID=9365 RepID=A0ABM3WQ29_ERIEU|nr:female-specific lacrimal gland protein-like [Erinaceus europaeus]
MASDYNMDRIREGGPLRCYFRDIRCSQNCDVLHIKFYKKNKKVFFSSVEICSCSKAIVMSVGVDVQYSNYSGQNEYDFIYTSKTMLIIKNVNTDGDKVTSVILALGMYFTSSNRLHAHAVKNVGFG